MFPFAAVQIPLLDDIVIIFALSVLVIFLFNKIKVPPIVGFLLTGIIAGPYGFGLINSIGEVEILAEIGVILILFSIGIEFSISKLLQLRKNILLGGSVQVLVTIGIFYLIGSWMDYPQEKAVFIGFLAALSSTAIILKLLLSNGELDSNRGKLALSILIFQDIIILPMFLLTPILAGSGGNVGGDLLIMLAKVAGIGLFLFISIKYVMPGLIFNIAKTRVKELFLISILLICFIVVFISAQLGISLALGAFLAGLIISETDYSHEALSFIEPFRDVFSSFFFVSIGMLLDLSFIAEHPVKIAVAVTAILIVKMFTGGLAARLVGYSAKVALPLAFFLAQIGEFSFVLSKVGKDYGLIDGNTYQLFLGSAVITMALTPFLFQIGPWLTNRMKNVLPENKKDLALNDTDFNERDHLVIVGYGINGRNIAKAADIAGLSYVIIEMNAITVKNEKAKGVPIMFGDATNEAVLHHAGIERARICVIAIADPAAVRAITKIVREERPDIHIIARTRFVQEVDPLFKLGANEVIPEEFETSVEIFARILTRYMIPAKEIEKFVEELRSGGYNMFRGMKVQPGFTELTGQIPDYEICSFRLGENSYANGKTLTELRLRDIHGVNALAIKRGEEVLPNPSGVYKLKSGDVLVVFGKMEQIKAVSENFK